MADSVRKTQLGVSSSVLLYQNYNYNTVMMLLMGHKSGTIWYAKQTPRLLLSVT